MRQIDILKDENESLLGESGDTVGELKPNASLLGEESLSDYEMSSLEQSNEQEQLTVRVEELQSQIEVMFKREKMLLEIEVIVCHIFKLTTLKVALHSGAGDQQ